MRVAFYTLGCKLNQCESEALASSFGSQGFFIVPPHEEADLYLVNTCTVTSKSEQKARRMIRKFSREHPEAAVIVTGCYAQMEPERFEELGPGVRVVSGDDKARLLDLPLYLNRSGCGAAEVEEGIRVLLKGGEPMVDPFRFDAENFQHHSRAFLKIQDGCDNRCSYCRVTLARGQAVSLAADEVVRRAERLEAQGYEEIVLTGINLSLYRDQQVDLLELTRRLTAATGRPRFRLSSLEPDYLRDDRIALLADTRIAPHFHLPVQSGDDGVLRAMARSYRRDDIMRVVTRLRQIREDPFIAADIIVGFPGEDESAFTRTVDLIDQVAPAGLHIFPYSRRPGTAAAGFSPQIPERIAGERADLLRTRATRLQNAYTDRWLGRREEILVETLPTSAHAGRGISGNYLQADIPYHADLSLQKGKRYPVLLEGSGTRLSAILIEG